MAKKFWNEDHLTRRVSMQDPRELHTLRLGLKGIETYLNHIGVEIVNVKEHSQDMWNANTNMPHRHMDFRITARCPEHMFNDCFSDFSIVIDKEMCASLNEEAILSSDISASMFDFDPYLRFEMRLLASCPEDMDTHLQEIKHKTKDILYKKFSESIDDEITEELGD